jgi:hypothetical protein
MKKIILKAITFLILLLLAFIFLNKYSLPNNSYYNTVSDFNEIIDDNKDLDVAIYGSSHAYCSYNPRVIDSITKTRSFNFGNGGQHLIVSSYVFDETIKKTNPKLVVLDVFSPFLSRPKREMYMSLQKYSYYYYDFSIDKVQSALTVFPSYDFIEVVFPIFDRKDFKYNFNFKKNPRYKFSQAAKAYSYRGYVGFDLTTDKKIEKTKSDIWNLEKRVANSKFRDKEFTTDVKLDLSNFIKKAHENGAEVLFVIAPYFDAFKDNDEYSIFYNSIKKISEANDVKLLDFNLKWKDLNLSSADFKDENHLNLEGGTKVSQYLGEYINKNYNLPSRENEEAWLEEQPINIKDFIDNIYEKHNRKLDFQIAKDLNFESLTIANINTSKKLMIKLGNQVTDSILRKYKLGFHTFVSEEDKENLMSYSKKKGRLYDAWDFDPEIIEVDHSKYIIKSIKTPINSFTKIQLFLYDRSGYKGLIGNKLVIDSVEIR